MYDIDGIDWKSVGRRIENEAAKRNWSLSKLAKVANCSPSYLTQFVSGVKSDGVTPINPTITTLFNMCNALDVELTWLLGIYIEPSSMDNQEAQRAMSLVGLPRNRRLDLIAFRDLFKSLEDEDVDLDSTMDEDLMLIE